MLTALTCAGAAGLGVALSLVAARAAPGHQGGASAGRERVARPRPQIAVPRPDHVPSLAGAGAPAPLQPPPAPPVAAAPPPVAAAPPPVAAAPPPAAAAPSVSGGS